MEHLRCVKLDSIAKQTLLSAAWQVIHTGVSTGVQTPTEVSQHAAQLQAHGASFITLTRDSSLRGCCGTVEAHQPLIEDVTANAWRTAFADPRFEPLVPADLAGLQLEISVLSPLRQIDAQDHQELLSNLEPGSDGLLICSGKVRATFLPKVWESLEDPDVFLQQLMLKAGLPLNRWPKPMEAYVYTAQLFGESEA